MAIVNSRDRPGVEVRFIGSVSESEEAACTHTLDAA